MTDSRHDDLFHYAKHLQQQHTDLTIDIVAATDSTQKQVATNSVLIADSQESGVGRRGNQWLSPPGQAISLSYRFQLPLKMAHFSGYQLTVGLAITACLRDFGCAQQRLLKWPNDLCFQRRKFGGILIHLNPGNDPTITEVIIGIGLNWRLSQAALKRINQPVCNVPLSEKPDRGIFIDRLLQHIKQSNRRFCEQGLAPFLAEWSTQDSLHNSHIELHLEQAVIRGDYAGLSSDGALQIMKKGQIQRFDSGEVKVRPL